MNARPNLDCTIWNVMCDGEIEAYATRDEAKRAVQGWLDWGMSPVVVEFNALENHVAEVTLDFLPDEDDEPELPGQASPAELLREYHGRVL